MKIEALYNQGVKPTEIAKIIGCCRATIYNELKRGLYEHKQYDWSYKQQYSAELAQNDYNYKATAKGVPIKLSNDYELAEFIETCILDYKWSPDIIIGFIKVNHLNYTQLSTSTLYSYIKKGIFYNINTKNLLQQGKRKRSYKRFTLPVKNVKFNSISSRCHSINNRISFGHWEMDTVIGTNKGKKECLLVLTERYTRQEILIKIQNKDCKSVINGLCNIKKDLRYDISKVFQTITVDNGSEFSDYQGMKNITGAEFFYCHPYSSWERGSNENANKLIRRFIPKGVNIAGFTDEFIGQIQNYMNTLPRKILGYRCSQELFNDFLKAV